MRRFVFPLESLLKLRRVRETQARQSYATAAKQRKLQEKRLGELAHARLRAISRLRAAIKSDRADLLAPLSARMLHIDRSIRDSHAQLAEARRIEAEMRTKLLSAARECRIVERLRDRRASAFRQEQQRANAIADDEIATIRYGTDHRR